MFDLRRPCPHCPFRTDIRPFLRSRRRAREIAASVENALFECHETLDYSGGEGIHTRKSQYCAGALIVMIKEDNFNQMMRIGTRTGWDPDLMDMDAPVFDSLADFIQAQPRG